jgi:hypothetical protein
MPHKLDLVPFYINGHRKLQSKWISVSFNDLVLLAGYSLGEKDFKVEYRYSGDETYSVMVEQTVMDIHLSSMMEIRVTER